MKLIIAYINPEALPSVKDQLFKSHVNKISIIPDAVGCGQQKGHTESYRGQTIEIKERAKTRLEIAVNDEFVQPAIDAIVKGAQTGKVGDGKIFVYPLENCIRIRTGESGPNAIG